MVETTQYPTPDDAGGAREHESASHQMVRAAPRWLRDLGFTSWLLVGVTLLLVGAVWLLALTQTIVMPLIAAGVIAAVASPVVAWLKGHGVPRALGAVLLLLALVLVGALVVVVIVGGISSESASISKHISSAETTVQGWLKDLGIDPKSASSATSDAHSATSSMGQALLHGVTVGRGEAVVAGVLPRADAAQPGVPAQGRADDPRLGRASRGRARRDRAHGQRPDPAVAARLLLRGHDRGGVQRGGGRRRGGDPRHPAGGDDRRGDVRRRLHPLPRRLDRRAPSRCCSRSAARARRRRWG